MPDTAKAAIPNSEFRGRRIGRHLLVALPPPKFGCFAQANEDEPDLPWRPYPKPPSYPCPRPVAIRGNNPPASKAVAKDCSCTHLVSPYPLRPSSDSDTRVPIEIAE